ncbi:unnamed protein product, partial [Amoebophrya sp. A120]|eukprot:GSA120T00003538001.1
MTSTPCCPALGLRVLVLDYYDSYTYNLVDLIHCLTGEKPVCVYHDQFRFIVEKSSSRFTTDQRSTKENYEYARNQGEIDQGGQAPGVVRNEEGDAEDYKTYSLGDFDAVVLSPGPGHPDEYVSAAVSTRATREKRSGPAPAGTTTSEGED